LVTRSGPRYVGPGESNRIVRPGVAGTPLIKCGGLVSASSTGFSGVVCVATETRLLLQSLSGSSCFFGRSAMLRLTLGSAVLIKRAGLVRWIVYSSGSSFHSPQAAGGGTCSRCRSDVRRSGVGSSLLGLLFRGTMCRQKVASSARLRSCELVLYSRALVSSPRSE
jgi:hypothetical protein